MEGTERYCKAVKTGQYGRFYVVNGSHARGETFHVYLLPIGEEVQSNGPNNAPLNSGTVELFGVIDGNPGWDERYGWLHEGKWIEDFEKIVRSFELMLEERRRREEATTQEIEKAKCKAISDTLAAYEESGY